MNICIDSTSRKLTTDMQGVTRESLPALDEFADFPVRDWTKLFRYVSSIHKLRHYGPGICAAREGLRLDQ